ncbi:unnamed protein product [Protopolystoma xenopodis]|uniref:Uncharacterized protein n=1 Tax=Protopolystoma xenopodis TaxID=117903 RepID=A0A3S5AX22_9PLAT|nr:unnamed protein product [Protopolystoma xenopodis]
MKLELNWNVLPITKGWPSALVCAYRAGQITPCYLDPIFSGSLILRTSVEAVFDLPSIYEVSSPIITIIVSLILPFCNDWINTNSASSIS